jgi:hypothetical protein
MSTFCKQMQKLFGALLANWKKQIADKMTDIETEVEEAVLKEAALSSRRSS